MASLESALRCLRGSQGLTQRQVATALRVPPSTVSAWEMGRRQSSLERLGQLADLLELDLGDLDDALELAGASWTTPWSGPGRFSTKPAASAARRPRSTSSPRGSPRASSGGCAATPAMRPRTSCGACWRISLG